MLYRAKNLCALLSLFLALQASAGGQYPSTNDLWDINRGSVVTGSSAVYPGSDVRNMFGGQFGTLAPGVSYFADGQPPGFVHYVEWQTVAPVDVDSFALFAHGDGAIYNNEREFAQFVLKAKSSPAATNFDLTLYTYVVTNHPYNVADPTNNPMLVANITPVTAQYFRAEFTQYTAGRGYDGPLIVELDGFSSNAPTILTNPVSQVAVAGSSATFSVSATGGAPLSYQWEENGTNIPVSVNPTATNSSLVLSNVQFNLSGDQYSVLVTNADGLTNSSNARLTVISSITRYVALNSVSPLPPYTNWATAATNIQDAIDAASPGDIIFITNGVYATGGRVTYGSLTNRVALNKPLIVQSVNGPSVTVIQGYQVPGTTNGDSAVRCAYLTNGAMLSGFTLTNGATRSVGDPNHEDPGGGVFCEAGTCIVSNCVIVGNSAYNYGGGACHGTLNNCVLKQNSSANFGGGASGCTLNNCFINANSAGGDAGGAYVCILQNCTVTGNFSTSKPYPFGEGPAGGTDSCVMGNCVIFNNTASTVYSNDYGSTMNYCCTLPLPAAGIGNIGADPQLADSTHLSTTSPCINTGNPAYASLTDLDGNLWSNPPSMGCEQYLAASATGPLGMTLLTTGTNSIPGFALNFSLQITGIASSNHWDFGDGVTLDNDVYSTHTWASAGDYVVHVTVFNNSNPGGISAAVLVHVLNQQVLYVSLSSTNPVAPYLDWTTAATNIQDAVDAAQTGNTVLVSNGIYATGMSFDRDADSYSRLVVKKLVTVQSLNGPASTFIQGSKTDTIDGVRCVCLGSGAILGGFTLTNGYTYNGGDDRFSGGGVICTSGNPVVSNCVITGCTASQGGGACNFPLNPPASTLTLLNCTISSNTAMNFGGGTYLCTAYNCNIFKNFAYDGGGAVGGALNGCLLISNTADYLGGGAWTGTLDNCTLVGNSSYTFGGGVYSGTLNNCIVFSNSAPTGSNYTGSTLNYSCTTPMPANGKGNMTNDPAFVNFAGGNFHLQSISPCINAGNNLYITNTTDLDGNVRIVGGTVDIGAYEFQNPTSLLSYAWAQQFNLPTDGSSDFADPDRDGMNNYQEWRAGTDPTNPSSVLSLLSPANSGTNLVVTWQSVTNVSYYLQRATNLTVLPTFQPLATNLPGRTGTTSYTDTNAAGPGPFFYRVGVQ